MGKIKNVINNNIRKIIFTYKVLPLQAKVALWYMICSVIQKALAFITTPIFTRIMSTEDFGLYSLYNSWYWVVSVFATLNLCNGAYNNGMFDYKDRRDYYTGAIQGLSTVVSICVFVLYLPFYRWIFQQTGLTLWMCSLMFCEVLTTPALNFWTGRQRFEYKYKALIFVTILLAIVRPFVSALVVIVSNNKGNAYIISYALIQFTIGVFFYIYNIKKGKVFCDLVIWKNALSFNLPLIPHYLSQTLLNQADKIMIGFYFGKSQVGIYQLAYSLAMVTTFINTSINDAYIPWIYENLSKKNTKEISQITRMLLSVIAVLNISIILFGKELIWLMGGAKYMEALYVLPPITWSIFFMFLYSIFGDVEFFFKKSKYSMVGSVIACLANVVLNAIILPKTNYIAAGYTTLVSYMILAIAHYYFVKKIEKEKDIHNIFDYRFILLLSIVGTCIVCFISLTCNSYMIRYSIIVIAGVLIFQFRKKIKKSFETYGILEIIRKRGEK